MFGKLNKFKRKLRFVFITLLAIAMSFPLVAFAPMQEDVGFFDAIDWTAVNESFLAASVFGIPIIFLVIGLVYALGDKFNVTGKAQFLASLGIGLVFGGGYQAAVGSLGYSFLAIFSYVCYGLLMGLFASLLYDAAKDLLSKILAKMLGNSSLGEG